MNEDMIVEMLAEAILDVIKANESTMTHSLTVIPEIRLEIPGTQDPIEIDGLVVDNALKQKIQQRVQEGIWEMHHPSILH